MPPAVNAFTEPRSDPLIIDKIRPLLFQAVDHSVRFTYGTALITSALERFVCDFAPHLAQRSSRQPVVPERVGIV